ncbi:MAG: UDP-glucose/GDP-mannose dehydrogenase family protein [Deltaproteobacteria bacterium]|nr:UDP-glucose/GDP-mannose dehydrogenase family protein [Deltaproteobacteria bacterium]
MNICVIGTGYVGLVTGSCFAEFGLNVTCVDNDEQKIALLQKGTSPIFEPGLEEMVKRNLREGRLVFTTEIDKAVEKSLVIFIAVGTPPKKDGSVDMTYIDEVARKIGENLNGYKVIATKSTVPVGTGERIRKVIQQYERKKVNFDIVSNPEFLREGAAIEDFMRPNRVVIGAASEQAMAIMKDLYSPLYLIEAPFVITNIETAEMIKYASNAFLATKVSFINEIANICEKVGADVNVVAKGMGLDQRIGSKFLHAGPGYGGSCFPKDTLGIAKIAEKHGYRFEIVRSVMKVNEKQKERMVAKVKEALGNLKGKTIAVLGLSFKPNTDDMREAPSLKIISSLQREGAKIRAYDPKAMEVARKIFKKIEYGKDPYDVAKGSDALLIITEWNQFRNLDLKRLQKIMKSPVFLDFRNIYEPAKMREMGFKYFAVGR